MAAEQQQLWKLTACQLASLIRSREVTPTEVVESCLVRVKAVNPQVNAFVFLCEQRARDEAAAQTKALAAGATPGPLWGIPIGVKDLEDAEGLPTSYGCMVFAPGSADYEASVARSDSVQVRRLRAAGAIVIGKTNTPLFGSKASTSNKLYGITRNPWDLDKTPGGSSGGSAAAVTARMVPLATGSDGGGSIRIPACLSGCFGIKPTFGLVPINEVRGFETESWSRVVHYGPLARCVEDAALFLDIVSGYDSSDPNSFPLAPSAPSFLSSLQSDHTLLSPAVGRPARVAFSSSLGYVNGVRPDVDDLVRRAVEVFSKTPSLFAVTEIDSVFTDVCQDWVTLLSAEGSTLFGTAPVLRRNEDKLEKSFLASWQAVEGMSVQSLADVYRHRFQLNRQLDALFENYDILLTPTLAITAFGATGAIQMDGFDSPVHPAAGFTIPFNFSGHPAASIRCGLSPDSGLPVGLQIVGPRHKDAHVLQIAHYYQEATRCFATWPEVRSQPTTARL